MTSFRSITGQRKAAACLKRAILSGRISHAYLFAGDASSGGADLAQAFAQALLCTTLDSRLQMQRAGRESSLPLENVDACGTCRSCIQASDGNQPDLITWNHSNPKTFTVEDARRLVADVQIRPFQSARKIYLIPDAQLMNTEAQNTLLKTLEEPPEYAVLLILCDSADRLLETIRSRCVLLELEDPGYGPSPEILQAGMPLLLNLKDWPLTQILDAVHMLSELKDSIEEYLELFTSWYRDLLYFKAASDEDGLLHKEYVREIRDACGRSSWEGLHRCLQALQTASERLSANVNFDLTMELLLLAMKENGGSAAK